MRRFRKTIRKPETLRRKGKEIHADARLDLHGFTLKEATNKLNSIISRGNVNSVLIIHGKGTGTLRNGIRRFLNSSPAVKSVKNGETEKLPGGDGVTFVTLV